MKLLVTTQADKNIKNITQITHPLFKKFAKKWGADFYVINNPSDCFKTIGKYHESVDHYRILNIYELYEKYDRILYLDSDMIINKNCPNIFKEVPYESIGVAYEDCGGRKENRRERIQEIQSKFGNVQWETGFPNVGTFITSKIHKNIFTPIEGEWWLDLGYDCTLLGYQFNKFKFPIQELSFKWNHMSMFSESWNHFANRFNSYIIHYAGAGVFERGINNREEQIKKDFKIIYN